MRMEEYAIAEPSAPALDGEGVVLLGQHDEQCKTSTAKQVAATIRMQTIECVTATVVIGLTVGLCFWAYFNCTLCLVGIMVLCLFLCPCVHYYNFPLWLAIVLLGFTLWGYLTVGELRVGPYLFKWSRIVVD